MLEELGGVTVATTDKKLLLLGKSSYIKLLNLFHRPKVPTDEHLPDLIWCREPFFEELNEIEALNDIPN